MKQQDLLGDWNQGSEELNPWVSYWYRPRKTIAYLAEASVGGLDWVLLLSCSTNFVFAYLYTLSINGWQASVYFLVLNGWLSFYSSLMILLVTIANRVLTRWTIGHSAALMIRARLASNLSSLWLMVGIWIATVLPSIFREYFYISYDICV